MIKQIINRLFHNPNNPNNYVKKKKNISLSTNTILLESCSFRFDGKLKNNQVTIGSNTMLGCSFIFETDSGKVNIGDNTFINAQTSLISMNHIIIGNNVTISWGCTIYDHNSHSLDYKERRKDIQQQNDDYRKGNNFIASKDWSRVKSNPIIIEDDVWIGFDSVILNGVTIGKGAIIGARSVVREDVEPYTVVAGNPAVVIKRLDNE